MPRIVHFDIAANNPEKAVEFYSKVFGWEFKKWNGPMEYWLVMTGPENKPGIDGGLSRGEPLNKVVLTIDVISLDEMIEKIEANGGKIIMPKSPIPGVGWMANFQSPDGNAFCIMQEDRNAK
jgi:hypothetical protein